MPGDAPLQPQPYAVPDSSITSPLRLGSDPNDVAVLLCKDAPLPVDTVAPILARTLGIYRGDAIRIARRQRGLLLERVPPDIADRVGTALAEVGVETETVSAALYPERPRPRSTFLFHPREDGIVIAKERAVEGMPIVDQLDETVVPWSRVALFAAHLIRRETATTRAVSGGAFKDSLKQFKGLSLEELRAVRPRVEANAAAVTGVEDLSSWLDIVDREAFQAVKKDLPGVVIDIVLDDPRIHYRADGEELIPDLLGDQRSPNWLRNVWLMIADVVKLAPSGVYIPAGTRALANREPTWSGVVDLLEEAEEAFRWHLFRADQAVVDGDVALSSATDDTASPSSETEPGAQATG